MLLQKHIQIMKTTEICLLSIAFISSFKSLDILHRSRNSKLFAKMLTHPKLCNERKDNNNNIAIL